MSEINNEVKASKPKKPFYKRAWFIVLVVLVVIGIFGAAFGSGDDSKKDSDNRVATEKDKKDEPSKEDDDKEEENKDIKNDKVTIEEQVLFEGNDIKITAKSIEKGIFGVEVKLVIENNSGKSITVQTRDTSVNGYMVSTLMSTEVASGKKANDDFTISNDSLEECGIEVIASIDVSFHIFESDTWDDIVDTDSITINTSAAGTYTQEYDDSGDVLVDTNGVKIVCKGLSKDGSFWGPGVVLYIENNTDKAITIQVRDVSVNGFMVASTMSEDVMPGKKAISAVQFFKSDLESNSITEVTDVELYFHIFDEKTWEDIFNSDNIKLTF